MKLSLCIAALFAVDTVNGFTFVAPSRAPMKLFSEEATDVVDEVDAPPAAPAFKAGFKKGQVSFVGVLWIVESGGMFQCEYVGIGGPKPNQHHLLSPTWSPGYFESHLTSL